MLPIYTLFWVHPMFQQTLLERCGGPTSEACVVVTPRWIIEHIGQLLEDTTAARLKAGGGCRQIRLGPRCRCKYSKMVFEAKSDLVLM